MKKAHWRKRFEYSKDETILSLLDEIEERIGCEKYEPIDFWDADLCAIGIRSRARQDRLVYISTFNKEPGLYDFECERRASADDFYEVASRGSGRIDCLISKIEAHLSDES